MVCHNVSRLLNSVGTVKAKVKNSGNALHSRDECPLDHPQRTPRRITVIPGSFETRSDDGFLGGNAESRPSHFGKHAPRPGRITKTNCIPRSSREVGGDSTVPVHRVNAVQTLTFSPSKTTAAVGNVAQAAAALIRKFLFDYMNSWTAAFQSVSERPSLCLTRGPNSAMAGSCSS